MLPFLHQTPSTSPISSTHPYARPCPSRDCFNVLIDHRLSTKNISMTTTTETLPPGQHIHPLLIHGGQRTGVHGGKRSLPPPSPFNAAYTFLTFWSLILGLTRLSGMPPLCYHGTGGDNYRPGNRGRFTTKIPPGRQVTTTHVFASR